MRCYICNAYIEEPEFDQNHMALPCEECTGVVWDAVLEMDEESFDLEDSELEDEAEEDEMS